MGLCSLIILFEIVALFIEEMNLQWTGGTSSELKEVVNQFTTAPINSIHSFICCRFRAVYYI
jgi:hypothetical protein